MSEQLGKLFSAHLTLLKLISGERWNCEVCREDDWMSEDGARDEGFKLSRGSAGGECICARRKLQPPHSIAPPSECPTRCEPTE